MFQVFVVITTFVGSKVIAALSNERVRAFTIPFALAYRFAVLLTIGTIAGAQHFFSTAFGFVIVMIGCNGFPVWQTRNNPVLKKFLLFYTYMSIVVFFGYHPLEGICEYLNALMMYMAGYFIAAWALRVENGLKKVSAAVMIAALLVIFRTFTHGGFSSTALAETGRAGLDSGLDMESQANENWVALQLDCFMPFLTALVFCPLIHNKSLLLRVLSAVTLIVISLLLIRTGSRNGCLVLLPCAWYMLKAGGNVMQKHRRLTTAVFVSIVGIFAVAYSMRNAESIRAFDFTGENIKGYDTRLNKITSGRWEY